MALPKRIIINESAPRDGWQNWKNPISTETKLEYIKKMIDAGLTTMEITSYVHPKWVPQLADADIVTTEILNYTKDIPGANITALTLNGRGVERAIGLGMYNVCFVISASNEHNKRNSNKPTVDCIADFENMLTTYEGRGLNVKLALACTYGSPFGEEISLDEVFKICDVALKHGVKNIGVADSAGVSNPDHTRKVTKALVERFGTDNLSIHLHDTRGMGMANAFVAMEEGIWQFDAALGAMGGCPYIPGAKGNIGTEDLAWMAQSMGVETGLDLEKLLPLSIEMCNAVGAPILSNQASLYEKRCPKE